MRLIDADTLKSKFTPHSTYDSDVVREAIDWAPTVDGARWIPCSVGLPEEDTDVLVTVYFKGIKEIKPCYYVEMARHYDGGWHSDSDERKVAGHRHEVVAWKPLPEPYKAIQCDTCIHRFEDWYSPVCDGCTGGKSNYEEENGNDY